MLLWHYEDTYSSYINYYGPIKYVAK